MHVQSSESLFFWQAVSSQSVSISLLSSQGIKGQKGAQGEAGAPGETVSSCFPCSTFSLAVTHLKGHRSQCLADSQSQAACAQGASKAAAGGVAACGQTGQLHHSEQGPSQPSSELCTFCWPSLSLSNKIPSFLGEVRAELVPALRYQPSPGSRLEQELTPRQQPELGFDHSWV